MTLKDGKFYKDGQPYPLEFGNKEQIELINKVQQGKEEGFAPEIDLQDDEVTFSYFSDCVCGVQTFICSSSMNNSIGRVVKCDGCSLKYRVCEDEEYGFWYLKIV